MTRDSGQEDEGAPVPGFGPEGWAGDQRWAEELRKFWSLAEYAGDVIVSADEARVLTYVSPAVTVVLGWTPPELVGTPIRDLVHPDDVPVVAAAAGRLGVAHGRPETVQARLRCRDGSYRWVSSVGGNVLDDEGRVVGGVAVWRDIQEEVEAREALAESEELFRTAVESSPVGICLVAVDGAFLRVNPVLCELLGRDEEGMLAATWRELTHPDDLEIDLGLIDDMLHGRREAFRVRKRYLRPDGTVLFADLSVGCVRETDGTVRHFVAQIIDVTAEHAQQLVLAAERERLAAVLNSELEPRVFLEAVRDGDGRIVDFLYREANDAACTYMGMTQHDLQGSRLVDLYPRIAGSSMMDMYVEAIESGRPLELDNYRFHNGGLANDRRFDIRAARVGDGLSLAWRDVTDRHAAAAALAASERQYRLLAENASDMVALTDNEGLLQWVSPSIAAIGWSPAEAVGHPTEAFVHPEDQHLVKQAHEATTDGETVSVELRVRTRDDAWRWFRVRLRPVTSPEGTVTGRVSGWQDIHAEKAARDALVASEARFRMLADNLGDVLVELDPQQHITYVSASMTDVLGWWSDALIGTSLLDLVHPDDRGAVSAGMHDSREAPDGIAATRARMRAADGTYRWMGGVVREVRNADGTAALAVATLRDIHEDVEAVSALQEQATTDDLTGLMNRRELIAQVEDLLRRTPRTGQNLAVLFIDLDELKPINDTHGHAAGDAVIATVADRLRLAVRNDDLVARIGGDEYVVVLTSIRTMDDALGVAEKIQHTMQDPIEVGGTTVPATLSIGLTLVHPGDDPGTALNRADTALYQAKRRGGSGTAVLESGNG